MAASRWLDSTTAAEPGGVVDVVASGAVGDGETDSTASIQLAIDRCASLGGGTVVVPPGTFVVSTIVLCSNVTLHLSRGATLLGSTDPDAYPIHRPALRSYADNYTCRSMIYAEAAENVAITGGGTIDGRGAAFLGRPYLERPYLLRFVECHRVVVRDIVLRDSAMWVQHYLGCRDVVLDGLTIHSVVNINNDGIDIDSSERVRISNCDITSEDDAIVLKATSERPCRDVVISNCTLESDCNAFKIGTETVGDISDVAFSNSTVRRSGLAGVAIETVDGGTVERVMVSGLVMRSCTGGIFVRLGGRGRPLAAVGTADDYDVSTAPPRVPPGAMRSIVLSSIVSEGGDAIGCSITGLADAPIDDVTLSGIRLGLAGGGAAVDDPDDLADVYPEYRMFGPLPAYALYCRHVANLRLERLELRLGSPDARPAVACVDVTHLIARDVIGDTDADGAPIVRTGGATSVLSDLFGRARDGSITAHADDNVVRKSSQSNPG